MAVSWRRSCEAAVFRGLNTESVVVGNFADSGSFLRRCSCMAVRVSGNIG